MLHVFVGAEWFPTRLNYMSYMAGVVYEAGTACKYPSRAPVSPPVFSCVHIFCFLYFVFVFLFSVFWFCFVSLRPVSCVPNVANFSGFYILCPSVFSNIYLFGSFLCIALSTINCILVLLFTLFGPLYYLSFVTSRLLITTVVSSHFSLSLWTICSVGDRCYNSVRC
jgi:hypothetical protein